MSCPFTIAFKGVTFQYPWQNGPQTKLLLSEPCVMIGKVLETGQKGSKQQEQKVTPLWESPTKKHACLIH